MILEGKKVFEGIAMGRIAIHRPQRDVVVRHGIENTKSEIARFEAACKLALEQLEVLGRKAAKELGESEGLIFEIHRMMLGDSEYRKRIKDEIVTKKVNAEYAVALTRDDFARNFAAMDDAYMRTRAADIKDISNRIIQILQGKTEDYKMPEDPTILLAKELAPSTTLQLQKDKVLAIVTTSGSANSHTAILAKNFGIPAVTAIQFPEDAEGKYAIVDGYKGQLLIDPEDGIVEEYKRILAEEKAKKTYLQKWRDRETVTADGRKIWLCANISSAADIEAVLENDAEGIGLFRTEFLYMGRKDYPTEEEQFAVYKSIAESMKGKEVTIRTLDIGADKQIPYLEMEQEENPAMGYRGIRICLDRPELFKTQLRAIYRASCFGDISIMFPMITSCSEVTRIKEVLAEVKKELAAEGLPYQDCEIGVMIETPAAVMISDRLAEEVDFFSVGTNDLTQYTLAIDRQNVKLDSYYDPHHEAVLRMLQMVADNAVKQGCKIGICGELAADTTITETLLKMGYDRLSVSPALILQMRERIGTISLG